MQNSPGCTLSVFLWLEYQEANLELVLTEPRVDYQEEKVRKPGVGGRADGQKHPDTQVYVKEQDFFLEGDRVESVLYLELAKQQAGTYFKHGLLARRKQYLSVLALPFPGNLFLYLSS